MGVGKKCEGMDLDEKKAGTAGRARRIASRERLEGLSVGFCSTETDL